MTNNHHKVNLTKSHYEKTPFNFQDMRNEIFKRGLTYYTLQKYSFKNKKIIEIGCSTSFIGEYILKHFPKYNYLGIDINPQAVKIARSKGLNVEEGNNLNLNLKDNSSDLTISEGVIHHTPDPFRSFKELIRITKSGGLISLYVYNKVHYYYVIYKISFFIRLMNRINLGRKIIKRAIFPLFNIFYVQLGNRLYFKGKDKIPRDISWNIFSDQILTPIAHFFTKRQILEFANQNSLKLLKEKKSINNQGLMFLFKK